jgi:hypothetical protein
MFSRSLIVVLVSLFSFTQINAQLPNYDSNMSLSLKKKNSYSKTPDTYYLNPTWQMGVIELNSSEKMDATLIKYNIKDGFLELKMESDTLLLPVKEVKSVLLTDIDMLLTFSYSARKKIQSVSSLQKIEKLLKIKDSNAKPTPKECYTNQYWQSANITFDKDEMLNNALIKINLKDNALEIKKLETILVLPISRINKVDLILTKETLHSLQEYDNSSTKLAGLLNILYTKSDMSLASNHNLRVIVASGGSSYTTTKSNKATYKITDVFVLVKKNKLFRIDRKAKKNSSFFEEHWEQVANFIKTEKLSFKTKEDIIQIIDFYASLING